MQKIFYGSASAEIISQHHEYIYQCRKIFIPNTCSGRILDVVSIQHAWQVHAWQVHAWQVHAEAHTILSAQVLLLHLSKPVLAVTLHTSSEHSQGLTKTRSRENQYYIFLPACPAVFLQQKHSTHLFPLSVIGHTD